MIDQSILLQVDATVIAGVLILLTIGHFRNEPEFTNRSPLSYRFATAIIVPFGFSAMIILVMSIMTIPTNENALSIDHLPTWSTFAGFFYLIVFMGVLTYKKGSRPNFDFDIKKHYWYAPEEQFESVWYTIMIEVLLKNTSDRDTMINSVSISFTYKDKPYFVDIVASEEIEMKSGDSKTRAFNFNINENEIEISDNIKNVQLKIVHTHDYKVKTIPVIKKLHRG